MFEAFNFIYFDTASRIHPGFPLTVSLMPFSTAFSCQFFIYRLVFNTYVSIAFIVLVQTELCNRGRTGAAVASLMKVILDQNESLESRR